MALNMTCLLAPPKLFPAQTGDRLSGLKRGDERGGLVLYNGLLGKPRVAVLRVRQETAFASDDHLVKRDSVAIGSHP